MYTHQSSQRSFRNKQFHGFRLSRLSPVDPPPHPAAAGPRQGKAMERASIRYVDLCVAPSTCAYRCENIDCAHHHIINIRFMQIRCIEDIDNYIIYVWVCF